MVETKEYNLDHFIELEKSIKRYINTTFEDSVNYLKSQHKELHLPNKIIWEINRKTCNNKMYGEISSNSLYKYYHLLLKENQNESKIKNCYEELLNRLTVLLNDNTKTDLLISKYVHQFEIKNNYLNIFLKSEAKDFIDTDIQNRGDFNTNYSNKFYFAEIGTFHSCFPEKFSIPRQGNLISKTRGKIVLTPKLDLSCLQGMEEFSYYWIIYVFHLHLNFKSTKISPPKLYSNQKLGIFATRTPHRLNPIGMTLVRLDKIVKNEIYISGIDMVEGTPIIDIKPYHHMECINDLGRYPDWVKDNTNSANESLEKKKTLKVNFNHNSLQKLRLYLPNLEFYSNFEEIYNLIINILEIDPHSKHSKKKQDNLTYAFYIDKLNIIYRFYQENGLIEIIDIEFCQNFKKTRTKEWLENLKLD